MRDEGQDISYFIYELDYGRDYKHGCVTDSNGIGDFYLEILSICVSLQSAGRILNLCNRLWHKFLGEQIVCC